MESLFCQKPSSLSFLKLQRCKVKKNVWILQMIQEKCSCVSRFVDKLPWRE